MQMHMVTRDAFLEDVPFYRNEFRCTDKHGVEHWMQEFVTIHKLDENRWQTLRHQHRHYRLEKERERPAGQRREIAPVHDPA